jgi:hypothetical protein
MMFVVGIIVGGIAGGLSVYLFLGVLLGLLVDDPLDPTNSVKLAYLDFEYWDRNWGLNCRFLPGAI